MRAALRLHWPEYLIEATGLGLFMMSASLFAVLLFHPSSLAAETMLGSLGRRTLMGLAMGSTAVALVYSRWGKRSGAHFNPAVTVTFFRLGKVSGWDAVFYGAAQSAGGLGGMLLAAAVLHGFIAHPSVNYVATVPGARGMGVAFAAEVAISFALMSVVLRVSNTKRLSRFTGLLCGALVATYIMLEAPLSGMSMNPARSFASALPAHLWTAFWIYLTAPPLGMLLAAELHVRTRRPVLCAKLHHDNAERCIFRCNYGPAVHAGG
jgi:aquaporin Z